MAKSCLTRLALEKKKQIVCHSNLVLRLDSLISLISRSESFHSYQGPIVAPDNIAFGKP